MRYISTRGAAPTLAFDEVLLAGLARDGGLYVPETWPTFSRDELRAMRGLPYAELAVRVMAPFLGGRLTELEFAELVREAYAEFDHAAVTPLVQLDQSTWVMELFHGPTLAFKDVALQLLGRLFDHVLAKKGQHVTIVGATSGDTGSAAIEACRDRDAIDIFILHPKGRTSEVQRRQMTTVLSSNVHNIALEGSFDDCQDLVKAMFNDTAFRDEQNLSAVNSINWARIMAQIVYYFAAAVQLGAPDRPVSFAVPTGNFGNVYAAYGARAMGLPIERLVVGTNSNDILARFFATGTMSTQAVTPTISPSMDIQISSNFERLLFDLYDRDGAALADCMARFRAGGSFAVTSEQLSRARLLFNGHKVDEDLTQATMTETRRLTGGMMIDPHTAVGLAAARAEQPNLDPAVPLVTLACAHPAKFPDAVERATGVRPPLPPRLADLYEREERLTVLPNDLKTVQSFVRSQVRRTIVRQGVA
ncbi:threonine synthase [Skermanella stibiiresistens SB22]|uniref:Threonine synthase n=1 Tax=Skermanella stibiiresistens SB22 TaxID=1385369 RepID=W9HFT1_9PROT|nr:threonine synthase [Skermanella stibiiresistens]EWY42748.1 threonine synthase [Skermanella stibiiresistens SB22]